MLPKVALIQGLYFLLTGVWPIAHIESFLLVTGPKVDLWLVKTVGILVAVIGVTLISASRGRRITDDIVLLAAGSALGLAIIDVGYGSRISPAYLADAAGEMGLIVLWIIGRARA
jgi:hypothetical protein